MGKLNVGIVGCGLVAHMRHIPALLRLRRSVNLCAVCDIDEDLAASTAEMFGIPKVYSGLDDMLSSEELDIVDVCTPPKTHASVAVPAMENGCHILLEKPMASTVSDCDRMIEAANKHGVKFSIVHNNLFNPGFVRLRKLVESGAIGKVTGLRIYWTTPPDEMLSQKDHWAHRLPGGLIGETGPHLVYLSLAFMQKVADVAVYAMSVLDHPWAPFDNFALLLQGEDLVVVSIVLSYTNSSHVAWIDVLGTEGVLHLDIPSRVLVRYKCTSLSPFPVAASSVSVAYQIARGLLLSAGNTALGVDKPGRGHEVAIEMFVNSVLNNQPVAVTPEDGRETVRVVDMIVKRLSAIQGVQIP